MARSSLAVRLNATLAVAGSILTLSVAGVLVWVAFNGPEQSTAMKPALLALAVFFAALTGWGMATAAGVFRRRGWARGSMLIFAVLLAGMGGSAVLGIAFIRMPLRPDVSAAAVRNIRLIIAAFYAGLLMIGVWWLL